MALGAGMQSFSVKLTRGGARIRRFELFPASGRRSAGSGPACRCAIAAHQVEGLGSEGFLARQEGLQMDREVQAMGIFGSRFQTDGFIEADFRFRGDGAEKSAGLFLRLSENSYHPDQIAVGHRGYYVGFDMKARLSVDRMNFNALGRSPPRPARWKRSGPTGSAPGWRATASPGMGGRAGCALRGGPRRAALRTAGGGLLRRASDGGARQGSKRNRGRVPCRIILKGQRWTLGELGVLQYGFARHPGPGAMRAIRRSSCTNTTGSTRATAF